MKDYYSVLGLNKGVSDDEIKKWLFSNNNYGKEKYFSCPYIVI